MRSTLLLRNGVSKFFLPSTSGSTFSSQTNCTPFVRSPVLVHFKGTWSLHFAAVAFERQCGLWVFIFAHFELSVRVVRTRDEGTVRSSISSYLSQGLLLWLHFDNTEEDTSLVLLLRRMAPISRSALSDAAAFEVDGRHDGTLYTKSWRGDMSLWLLGIRFLPTVWFEGAFRSLQNTIMLSLTVQGHVQTKLTPV